MRIEDVVLVATVRENIRDDDSKTEIPLRIEATQARIAQTASDVIGPASLKNVTIPKEPVLAEAVIAGLGAEGDSDNGSKTVATSPEEDGSDKRGSDEHLVSPCAASASGCKRINKTQPPKAGASVISLEENNKQEAEQQIQEATSENRSGDHVEEDHPSESKDGASEKESKKTKEETRETEADLGADQAKAESAPSDAPRIANALTEEPEAQEESKKPERADGASAPQAISRTSSVAQEPQAPARATPLYWRRLTARYMSVGPQPS
jgi:hypothetical protein